MMVITILLALMIAACESRKNTRGTSKSALMIIQIIKKSMMMIMMKTIISVKLQYKYHKSTSLNQ